jgi:hypothetical protein
MVPIAFAGDTARWLKPDSWYAKASARLGSTPMERAVSATICFISACEGAGIELSRALLELASATTLSGYW